MLKRWKVCMVCVLIQLTLIPCSFANSIQQVEQGLRAAVIVKGHPRKTYSILERMKYYHVPGVSVAVIDQGKIAWAKGYGLKENGKSDSVTPETLFEAGSISKPISALGAMQLVQSGLLSLDEDVNHYLKSWKVPENEYTKAEKVTLRRILSHSAGLTVHGFPGYAVGIPLPSIVQVLNGTKPITNTEPVVVDTVPGTLWRYSGGGTTIEQLLIEDTTGKPFAEWMKEKVLIPLDLSHSTYEQPLPVSQGLFAASAHRNDLVVPGRWHNYPELAAAGLWSNPADLAKTIIAIQEIYGGDQSKLLSPSTVKEMLTEQKKPSGLGPMVYEENGVLVFEHGGVNEGFVSLWHGFINPSRKNDGQGLVVMTNSSKGADLIDEIAAAVGDVYQWPHKRPIKKTLYQPLLRNYDLFLGDYRKENSTAKVTQIGKNIQIQFSPDDETIELFQESKHTFFNFAGSQFQFIVEKKKVKALVLIDVHGNRIADFDKF